MKNVDGNFLGKRLMKIVSLSLLFILCIRCSNEESTIENQMIQEQMERTGNNLPINLGVQTFLALGDSYTIGTGTPIELNWPNQLKDKLIQDNLATLELSIIAQNGWTTRRLLEAIKADDPEPHDLVSLMIGVNNQFQKLPFDTFKKEFDELLEIAINLSGEKKNIFVVSIPDYSVTRFGSGDPVGISNDIDRYNAYIQKRCEDRVIHFVDVTEISRELGSSSTVLADDGLHPSPFQYSRWLENITPAVKKLFEDDLD